MSIANVLINYELVVPNSNLLTIIDSIFYNSLAPININMVYVTNGELWLIRLCSG